MARRLLFSYLALIAVAVVALAFIVQTITAQTFSRYLGEQSVAHSEMLPVMLAGYYTSHGSWDGVQADIDNASILIGAQVTLVDRDQRVVAATRRDWVGQTVSDSSALGSVVPVIGSANTTLGLLYVGRNLALQRADEAFLTDVTRALILAGIAVAALAAGLGLLLARSISRPLIEMSRAAAQLAMGNYGVRISAWGHDEVGTLAQAFNQMAQGLSGVEQMRRDLVANISHDLRTPLTVIRGYLEGLRSGEIADRRTAEVAFDAMHTEVDHLLNLVSDLRYAAALDAGASPIERRPTSIDELARNALDRIAPLAIAKSVALVSAVPAGFPSVNLDPERMGQALFNLLENSVRHTPAGGMITLQAGLQTNTALPVVLSVRDSGDGIAPEHLPHIFERFYRADPARSRAEGGAGLGLAIVKATVEAHGGTVSAESPGVPGRGSVFTIRLPL